MKKIATIIVGILAVGALAVLPCHARACCNGGFVSVGFGGYASAAIVTPFVPTFQVVAFVPTVAYQQVQQFVPQVYAAPAPVFSQSYAAPAAVNSFAYSSSAFSISAFPVVRSRAFAVNSFAFSPSVVVNRTVFRNGIFRDVSRSVIRFRGR